MRAVFIEQEIREQGEVKAALGIGQEQRQAPIAVAGFSVILLVLFRGIGGPIGTGLRLIGATVPHKTSLGIPRCGLAASIGASQGVTITALALFLFGRAGPRVVEARRSVAALPYGSTAHAGSCMQEHAIRADLGLAPGLGTEQTGFADQGHGADEELVEVLDGHFARLLCLALDDDCVSLDVGVVPQGSKKMAQAAFRRIDAVFEAKESGIVGIARVG